MQYIVTRLIMDLCERSARRMGVRVFRRWWGQAGLDLDGAKKRAEAASESDEEVKIGEEEGMPLNYDGPGIRAGSQSSNLT